MTGRKETNFVGKEVITQVNVVETSTTEELRGETNIMKLDDEVEMKKTNVMAEGIHLVLLHCHEETGVLLLLKDSEEMDGER